MNWRKTTSRLALLLSLSVLLFPYASVNASLGLGPLLAVSPASVGGALLPGDTFTITVIADEVGQFNGYDISLKYNTTVLTATGVVILPVQGQNFQQLILVADDATGTIRVSAGLLGSTVTVMDTAPLFSADFVVDDFGSSALDLTNDRIALGLTPILHTTQDGSVATVPRPLPTSSQLIRWKIKPDFQHMHFPTTGNLQTLFARVANSGPNTATIKVVFFVSMGGPVEVLESNAVTLVPGDFTTVQTDPFRVTLPGSYTVVGVPFNSAEGILYFQGENSAVEVFKADTNPSPA